MATPELTILPTPELIAEKLTAAPLIGIELDAFQAFALVGQIQLALRHPENTGVVADLARRIADELSSTLIAIVPEIAPLIIAAGWITEGKCRVCGCTNDAPCPTGCAWVEEGLCSRCSSSVILAPSGFPAREVV
jgi:hypothetical protein